MTPLSSGGKTTMSIDKKSIGASGLCKGSIGAFRGMCITFCTLAYRGSIDKVVEDFVHIRPIKPFFEKCIGFISAKMSRFLMRECHKVVH